MKQGKRQTGYVKIGATGKFHPLRYSSVLLQFKCLEIIAVGNRYVRIFACPFFPSGWPMNESVTQNPTQVRHAMPPARVRAKKIHYGIDRQPIYWL